MSFGNVAIGSSSKKNLTVTNMGTGALTITQTALSGKGFSMQGPPLPLALIGGQSATFATTFAPTAVGDTAGSISITRIQSSPTQLAAEGISASPSSATQQTTVALNGAGVPVAPSVTSQPASQTITAGQSATFTVAASGQAPLSYQWQKNGAAISGATSATYSSASALTSDSGSRFIAVVSNSVGSVSSSSATLTVNAAPTAPLQITTSPLPNSQAGIQFQATLTAVGGVQPYQWSIASGTLPSGFLLDGTSGTLSGKPSPGGPFDFVVRVSDSSVAKPQTAMKTFTLSVLAFALQIAQAILPSGQVGVPFQAMLTGDGGVSPYTWKVTGALPPGLSLDASSGGFTGTPTQSGTSGFNIVLTDSAGQTTQKSLSIKIMASQVPPLTITTSSLPSSTSGKAYSAMLQAKGGATPYNWSVASGQLPPGLILTGPSGEITGTPSGAGQFSFVAQVVDGSSSQTTVAAPMKLVATAEDSQPSGPELPRVFLDTSLPVQSGKVIGLAKGGDFQAALNSAACGDTISLEAGATFTGNFTLPAKTCGDWIVIRTAAPDSSLPAPGTRLNPTVANALAKIVTSTVAPAINTQFGANHYRFVGIEVTTTIATTSSTQYGLIDVGDDPVTGNTATSAAQLPSYIFFDRCYIHGTPTGNVKRGVLFNGASLAVIDSYISDIHVVGQDSQAVGGWNGPGPFKIVDNYLEAAAENVMFGGATPSINGMIPSDIEIRGNHFFKPLMWRVGDPSYAGLHWAVKNLLEFKIAQRVLVTGNILENNWLDGQVGFAVLLTPRTEVGAAPWIEVQDITFTKNIVRHTGSGLNILGTDDGDPQHIVRVKRALIKDNLFDDVNGKTWGGDGRLFQVLNGADSVTIDHNTGFETTAMLSADGAPMTNFIFQNNIAPHSTYGVIGTGFGVGLSSLAHYFPAFTFTKNVIENISPSGASAASYPQGNFYPASWGAVMFANQPGGDYRLCRASGDPLPGCTGASPFVNAGSDGKDVGADMTGLAAATGGVI